MTDPLEFLHTAHALAERAARALPRGPWQWAHHWEESRWLALEGPDGRPVLRSHCDVEGARSWIELHPAFDEFLPDPEATLRRITAERKLIADLQAEPHQVKAYEDTWYYCAAANPKGVRNTRECDCGRDQRVGQYMRLLAEAWGWQPDPGAE